MNKKINTKYRHFDFVDCSQNEECKTYLKEFEQNKLQVNRLLANRDIENQVIDDFLNENNLKLTHFVYLLFYRDGAINEALLTAYSNVFKKAKLDFLNKNDFTFEYKSKYKDIDFEKVFASQKVKTRNMKIKAVIDHEVKKHYIQKGFVSAQDYIKHLFNDFGIYPDRMWDEVKKHIKNRKESAKNFDHDEKNIGYAEELYGASFTISKIEKEKLYDHFNEFLKANGLSVSKLVRYRLFELGIINQQDLHVDEVSVAKIKNLKYKAPKIATHIDKITINKKERETIVVLLPKNERMKEFLKGSTGIFVKYFVLKHFGMYPEIRSKDTSKLFINHTKVVGLFEKINERNKEEGRKEDKSLRYG